MILGSIYGSLGSRIQKFDISFGNIPENILEIASSSSFTRFILAMRFNHWLPVCLIQCYWHAGGSGRVCCWYTCHWVEVLTVKIGGNENVLEEDRGCDYTTLWIC